MKTYTVETYVPDKLDENGKQLYRKMPRTFQIAAETADLAKKQVRNLVKKDGRSVRTISFAPKNKILVYTMSRNDGVQIDSWRYKKPPTSQKKI